MKRSWLRLRQLMLKLVCAALLSTRAFNVDGLIKYQDAEVHGDAGVADAQPSLCRTDQECDSSMLLQRGSSIDDRSAMWIDTESELWVETNFTDDSLLFDSRWPSSISKIFGRDSNGSSVRTINNQSKYVQKLRDQMKLTPNDEGDLYALLSSVVVNCSLLFLFVIAFSILAMRYPVVYSENSVRGIAGVVPSGFFGWVCGSYYLQFEDIEKAAGLDAALFVEFTQFALRLCVQIALPAGLILCPLHAWCGRADLAGDKLSQIGIGHLDDGHWAFWVHAAFVWYVVLLTQLLVYQFQDSFVKRRYAWIARMPHPRDTTVLVEGIPRQFCSDDALKAHFVKLFSEEQVENAYVIKCTHDLEKHVAAFTSAKDNLAAAKIEWEQAGGTQDQRPMCHDYRAKLVDKLDYYTSIKREAAQVVEAERKRIQEGVGVVYTNTGFVTFKRRREAAVALYLKVEADDMIFTMSTPPDPADVVYADFMHGHSWLVLKELVGNACLVGLFFAFTPLILFISSLINEEVILKAFPVLSQIFINFPVFEATVSGVLASAALTIVTGFLPSIFLWIFNTFFQLKAGQWAQASLQHWYFWFQVIFILLIPAVGASLLDTILSILEHPMSIVLTLAYRLPTSTHFYMNYIVMQWMVHGMVLTRYVNLLKFKAFSAVFADERAKELSEPEDQDYYGIGGRSARFTLVLSIGLVYCSLAPLIVVLTGINFVVCRIFYGYLLVFAEKPKPDLGGVFWVAQLKHIQLVLFIYVLLMMGVMSQRAATTGPAVVIAPALFFLYKSFQRFHTAYDWEFQPFSELVSYESSGLAASKLDQATRDTYAQPELSVPKITEEDLGGEEQL